MKIRFILLTLLLSLLLSGCFGASVKSPRLYVMTPKAIQPEVIPASPQQETLHINIASVRIPPYLERTAIVTRNSENQISIAEHHRWAGKLRVSLARIMAQNLSILLNTPDVAIAPHSMPTSPDVSLELEILQFERDNNNQVQLSAKWRLLEGKTLSLQKSQITQISGTVITDRDDYDAIVASMSQLYAQLSEIIAKAMTESDSFSRK